MATDNTPDAKMAAEGDIVSIELPAPRGWKKKFTPKKGGTPGRNEIVFIAPSGEEIKTKTQLKVYLKLHPGDLTAKDFDWSTGDTPRRSARLSGKSKASESPDNETPKKRQRKSSSKKDTNEKNDIDDDKDDDKNEATAEETKESTEVSNADAEDTGDYDYRDVVTEKKALPEKDNVRDSVQSDAVGKPAAVELKQAAVEQKADAKEQEVGAEECKADAKEQEAAAEELKADAEEQEVGAEEHKPTDDNVDVQLGANEDGAKFMDEEEVQLKTNNIEDTDMFKEENQGSDSKPPNEEEEGGEDTSLAAAVSEEAKMEAENVPSNADILPDNTISHGAARTDMVLDNVEDLSPNAADAKAEELADKVEVADQPTYASDYKVETADAVEAEKDIITNKNEAKNQNSTESDTPMQVAGNVNQDLAS